MCFVLCLCPSHFSDKNAPIEEVKYAFFYPRHLNDRAPLERRTILSLFQTLADMKYNNIFY